MDDCEPNPVIARLRDDLKPETPLTLASGLRLAFELADAGVEMMRMNLVRRNPGSSGEEIDTMLRQWLHHRPGAESGDSWGRPVPERIPKL